MKRAVTISVCCCLCGLAEAQDAPVEQVALSLSMVGRTATRSFDDLRLQLDHALIGRVDIRIDDVFEEADDLSAPYKLANALHIATRVRTIAEQLLFRTGDAYNPHALAESARMLREQRYLSDATIEPVRYNDDNTVDVVVHVHDVWTLSPGISIGRKGGANSVNLEFEDTNFLGLGKQIAVERSSDVDRDAWRFAYKDPHLFGSWWRLGASHADMSDGREDSLSLSRPFYSLDTRWSLGVAGFDSTSTQSQYSLGSIVNQFAVHQQTFEIGGGISEGLQDGWVRRWITGMRYDARDYSIAPPQDGVSAATPEDRVLAYPWVGVEVIEDQYRQTRNLDQIGRTEDLHLGRSARIELGYASSVFASTHDALVLKGTLQAGFEPVSDHYAVSSLALNGRLEDGEIRNGTLEIGSRYYLRQSPRRVLFGAFSAAFTSNLDPDTQLLLGGDSGLRGYPLRYQAGTTRALVTLEERFYTRWQPLKLFNVGAAVFFDAGRTWGVDPYAAANGSGQSLGWLRDVGVGLRLGSARSGLGNVLHLDIACPLDGGRDIDSVQFLIETRRSF